ncbi:MAG: HEPN domain-containing protein [Bacteroides sp.]|nr:HEPN domain-containing protein [Bacteroides sp.]
MKTSLDHLSPESRQDLELISTLILEYLSDKCEMIILYGSYATGNQVVYDQRTDYGIPTFYMSDYDIMVVTSTRFKKAVIGNIFTKIKERYYKEKGIENIRFIPTIQFITESIYDLNKAIDKRRYFYYDLKKKGIVLHDSGKYQLAPLRKLRMSEVKEMAEEYFRKKFPVGQEFINLAKDSYRRENYVISSFNLHQACENFYRTVLLTFTLYTEKGHDLESLASKVKIHSLEYAKPFPRNTEKEEYLFQLLIDAYVQARYNPDFVVTREEIEILIPKVEIMQEITERICQKQILFFQQESQKEEEYFPVEYEEDQVLKDKPES